VAWRQRQDVPLHPLCTSAVANGTGPSSLQEKLTGRQGRYHGGQNLSFHTGLGCIISSLKVGGGKTTALSHAAHHTAAPRAPPLAHTSFSHASAPLSPWRGAGGARVNVPHLEKGKHNTHPAGAGSNGMTAVISGSPYLRRRGADGISRSGRMVRVQLSALSAALLSGGRVRAWRQSAFWYETVSVCSRTNVLGAARLNDAAALMASGMPFFKWCDVCRGGA